MSDGKITSLFQHVDPPCECEPKGRPYKAVFGENPIPLTVYERDPQKERDKYAEGLKFDDGKDPWHLAPWDAFRAIVKVLRFGAVKYEERNWEKGMAWSRPYAALMRHMTAWFEGERADPDTGFSHLWHAGCMLCFLISYELRGIGRDDRPPQ